MCVKHNKTLKKFKKINRKKQRTEKKQTGIVKLGKKMKRGRNKLDKYL